MDESVSKSTPKTRSWRIRWSLRVFIAGITLTSVLVAIPAHWMRIGNTHLEVSRHLQEQGAILEWELYRNVPSQVWVSFSQKPVTITQKEKHEPEWMRSLGCVSMFQRIDSIRIVHGSPGPVSRFFKDVAKLDRVDKIWFDHSSVDRHQLESLLERVDLNSLWLDETNIGLHELSVMQYSKLKKLRLRRSNVSTEFLSSLPDNLQRLDLEGCTFGQASLQSLIRLKKLTHINLRLTDIEKSTVLKLRDSMPWCEIVWQPRPFGVINQ